MIKYIKLLMYSCVFCIFFLFFLGGVASFLFYLKIGVFIIPDGEIKRGVIFGFIGGVSITLAAVVFKCIDKIKKKCGE